MAEGVAEKTDPALFEKLEPDAERAFFDSATVGTARAIIVSLRDDRQRRAQVLRGHPRTDPDNGVSTPLVHALRSWAFLPSIAGLP